MNDEEPPRREVASGAAATMLKSMWDLILRDYGVDAPRVEDLITEFSKKMTQEPLAKQQSWRGNLISDLRCDTLTWKDFIRALRITGAYQAEMIFDLHHQRYNTKHRFLVPLPPPTEPEKGVTEEVYDEVKKEYVKKPVLTDLAVFMRAITNELGIDFVKREALLNSFIRRYRLLDTARNKSHVRGNLIKTLTAERLQFPHFIMGFSYLEVLALDWTINLHFKQGKTRRERISSHKDSFTFHDPEDFETQSSGWGHL